MGICSREIGARVNRHAVVVDRIRAAGEGNIYARRAPAFASGASRVARPKVNLFVSTAVIVSPWIYTGISWRTYD